MLASSTLRLIAQVRVIDAEVLFTNARYDGAGYICGYALELTLKARIADTLNWTGYPETKREFENLTSFKTHNLDVLLALSGRESEIKLNYFADWSMAAAWNPEARYQAVGAVSAHNCQSFIESAKRLISILYDRRNRQGE